MNILFVNDIPFNPIGGGIERVTDVLSKELKKRGHCIFYLCAKLSQSQLYLLDYEFPAKLFQLPNHGLFENEENAIFYKKLQVDLQIDVVVNQRGLRGGFNSMLPITQTKLVSVIHSTPESPIFASHNELILWTSPPLVGVKRFIKRNFPFIISFYWKNKIVRELKTRYNELVCYSDIIVTLSKRYIDILKRFINVSHQSEIISIPNPNTINVIEPSFEQKEKIILYVGRLENWQKEPIRLLKVWNVLHLKFPDWQLIIVGDGGEKERMQEYVKLHGLNNVFFEGRQSDVAQYYQKASFICLTSNFEGFPMVLIEGMQYGCVPFTFKSFGAAYDIIDDGINGCLITPFSILEYSERLAILMQNDVLRYNMALAAIDKVKKFSLDKVVAEWDNLFKLVR